MPAPLLSNCLIYSIPHFLGLIHQFCYISLASRAPCLTSSASNAYLAAAHTSDNHSLRLVLPSFSPLWGTRGFTLASSPLSADRLCPLFWSLLPLGPCLGVSSPPSMMNFVLPLVSTTIGSPPSGATRLLLDRFTPVMTMIFQR